MKFDGHHQNLILARQLPRKAEGRPTKLKESVGIITGTATANPHKAQ